MLTLIRNEASRVNVSIDDAVCEKLAHYVSTLAHWNQRANLTADARPETLVRHHFTDAFILANTIQKNSAIEHLIDVGSGGGLPGLVMAILLPRIQITLVEARQKKCAFLRTVAAEVAPNATVVSERIEHWVRTTGTRRWDMAQSRATFSPKEWLNRAKMLVRPGGWIAVFLAAQDPLVLQQEADGLTFPLRLEYTTADGAGRALMLFTKLA